jgi:NTE family protein
VFRSGASRNLPVGAALGMDADVIITVDIGTPLRKRAESASLLSVSDQITRILTNTNVRESIGEPGARDLLVTPDLGTVATGDVDRRAEAAVCGEKAARVAAVQLACYSIDAAEYEAWHTAPVREPSRRTQRNLRARRFLLYIGRHAPGDLAQRTRRQVAQ